MLTEVTKPMSTVDQLKQLTEADEEALQEELATERLWMAKRHRRT